MTIEEIKLILKKLHFPERFISEQTAICIKALIDQEERKGLLPSHKNLSEGARIHDILNFARDVIGKKVAENTREAYRKTSLAPMMSFGAIVRHQLSPRDPNTYYRLHPDFARIFSEKKAEERDKLISQLQAKPKLKEAKRAFGEIARDHRYKPSEINGSDKYDVSIWKWTEERYEKIDYYS